MVRVIALRDIDKPNENEASPISKTGMNLTKQLTER